jgi:hypothetical protein
MKKLLFSTLFSLPLLLGANDFFYKSTPSDIEKIKEIAKSVASKSSLSKSDEEEVMNKIFEVYKNKIESSSKFNNDVTEKFKEISSGFVEKIKNPSVLIAYSKKNTNSYAISNDDDNATFERKEWFLLPYENYYLNLETGYIEEEMKNGNDIEKYGILYLYDLIGMLLYIDLKTNMSIKVPIDLLKTYDKNTLRREIDLSSLIDVSKQLEDKAN